MPLKYNMRIVASFILLSILAAPERRSIAQQLNRVDGLAAPADQQADVLALDPAHDLLLVLVHLDPSGHVELVHHPLEDGPNPVGGLVGQAEGAVT